MPSRYASLIITRKSEFMAKKLHSQYFLFKTIGHQRQYDDKFEYTFILNLFYYIERYNKWESLFAVNSYKQYSRI